MEEDEDDFGFSFISKEEISKEGKQTTQNKLEAMRKLILPLLNNLAKNEDKDTIYWPNRTKKIKDVISKINKLVDG
jgi:hypothetical protein